MRLSQIYSDFITSTKKEVAEKSEKILNEVKRTQCEATEGVSGNPFPVPLRGCHAVTGGWRQKKKERMAKKFLFGHPLIYFQE